MPGASPKRPLDLAFPGYMPLPRPGRGPQRWSQADGASQFSEMSCHRSLNEITDQRLKGRPSGDV